VKGMRMRPVPPPPGRKVLGIGLAISDALPLSLHQLAL
jgi:hypothetical protein